MKAKVGFALLLVAALVLVLVALVACQGPAGPTGPAGPVGSPGPAGPPGPPGASYVGSTLCATCHKGIADVFAKSGHPFKLTKVVEGKPPTYPFTETPRPPEGYTWADITYVIGGYGWKTRFLDKRGYIITGSTVQYNFANPVVGKDAAWVAYEATVKDKKYDCGACHTTGYKPTGNQDGLPGIVGTWSEPGIRCERCHGPGGNHIKDPYGVALKVDRTPELCGECHYRGAKEVIDASGGFIQHHEQYEELYQSKHLTLGCVACHDPHKGVIQGQKTGTATVRVECSSCHFQQAQSQKSAVMKAVVKCIDCHMPRIVKSAWGDTAKYTGDIRAHLFAIDPYATAQFSADGKTAISQVSLDFACKSCHRSGGTATVKTDEELRKAAIDYHKRP